MQVLVSVRFIAKYRSVFVCPVSSNLVVSPLHAGIDAKGLDPNLDCHHLVVNDWQDLEAAQNVCIISIPSVFDSSLAPAGKHTIHAYVAANEPYNIWQGLDKNSKEYKDLKVRRIVIYFMVLYTNIRYNLLYCTVYWFLWCCCSLLFLKSAQQYSGCE